MKYCEIKELNEKSKHAKISNIMFWDNEWKENYTQFQVNYKSGKTCFYRRYYNLPETAQEFIRNSNRKEFFNCEKEIVIVYFMV